MRFFVEVVGWGLALPCYGAVCSREGTLTYLNNNRDVWYQYTILVFASLGTKFVLQSFLKNTYIFGTANYDLPSKITSYWEFEKQRWVVLVWPSPAWANSKNLFSIKNECEVGHKRKTGVGKTQRHIDLVFCPPDLLNSSTVLLMKPVRAKLETSQRSISLCPPYSSLSFNTVISR